MGTSTRTSQAATDQLISYTVRKGSRIVEQGTVSAQEFLRIRHVWTMSLGANRSRYTVTTELS